MRKKRAPGAIPAPTVTAGPVEILREACGPFVVIARAGGDSASQPNRPDLAPGRYTHLDVAIAGPADLALPGYAPYLQPRRPGAWTAPALASSILEDLLQDLRAWAEAQPPG